MMREIKFRMWDVATKKYRKLDSIAFDEQKGLIKVANGWGKNIISDRNMICHREPPMFVLEQFTGLLDSKGKEIYEGDILETAIFYDGLKIGHIGDVVYSEEHASFATKNEAGITLFCRHSLNDRKVIGNIHES